MDTLIFVDSNILLAFYRVNAPFTSLSLLSLLEANKDRLITTDQVEMEFKKNRQNVITDALDGFRSQAWQCLKPPAFLAESTSAQAIEKAKGEIERQVKGLRKRIEQVLNDPSDNDPVYEVVERLFRHESPLNLNANNKSRSHIQGLARRRFLLGYPPRKERDLSCGDAVNWEWILECAQVLRASVVIVTRDFDYGGKGQKRPKLNNWLASEFKKKVTRRQSILLTNSLAEGLRHAGISVTRREIERERKAIDKIRVSEAVTAAFIGVGSVTNPPSVFSAEGHVVTPSPARIFITPGLASWTSSST